MVKDKIIKKKIVLTYGTFDLLHFGHINILKKARALGDYLIVGLSTDEFNAIKHKYSFFNYNQRKKVLESIKYVDKIIQENNWKQKIKDIKKYDINIFVMGDDWSGKFDKLKEFCKVVYLPRTKNISTTKIKLELKRK
jgi:glycerol-3-phosphate cytidylyltransferase